MEKGTNGRVDDMKVSSNCECLVILLAVIVYAVMAHLCIVGKRHLLASQ